MINILIKYCHSQHLKKYRRQYFLNNLARMLKNNIPINDSLSIIALNSSRWQKSHVNKMLNKMTSGANYAEALNTGLFGAEELLNITLYSVYRLLMRFYLLFLNAQERRFRNISKKIAILKSLSTLILGGCVIWVFLALYALTDALSKMSQY